MSCVTFGARILGRWGSVRCMLCGPRFCTPVSRLNGGGYERCSMLIALTGCRAAAARGDERGCVRRVGPAWPPTRRDPTGASGCDLTNHARAASLALVVAAGRPRFPSSKPGPLNLHERHTHARHFCLGKCSCNLGGWMKRFCALPITVRPPLALTLTH